MVRVRGSDTYVGVQLAIEATWGTMPGSPTWMQVPIVEDSVHVEADTVAKDQELGQVGAQAVFNHGPQTVKGSLTINPRYNLKVFSVLMAHFMGGSESRNADVLPNGTAQVGLYSTHCWMPQSYQSTAAGSESGVAPGLSGQFFRSGPTQGGTVEQYVGIVPVRMRWTQTKDARPTVTFDFIGIKHPTAHILSAAGLAKVAVPASIPLGARDVGNRGTSGVTHANLPGLSITGITNLGVPTQLALSNLTGFSFTAENGIEFAPAFANLPDSPAKPGHVTQWTVTGELQSLLSTTWVSDLYTPAFLYNTGASRLLVRIRYTSNSNADPAATITNGEVTVPYVFDIYFKNVQFSAVRKEIQRGGAIETVAPFECAKTPNGFGYGIDTGLPGASARLGMMLLQATASDADDGGTTYALAVEGGNDGNTDLNQI